MMKDCRFRISEENEEEKNMKTIAIYNNKGGCGKTVTAVNMAYNLTAMGWRTLVIDMDPQGNASSFFRRYDLNRPSMMELLTGRLAPSRCIYRTVYPMLDIIQANIRLREVDVQSLICGIRTLRSAGWVFENRYDYCIIDCPPSLDFLVEVIMDAADDVVIPVKPDRFSSDGLGTVIDVIQEFCHGKVTAGCLFTQFYRNRDSIKAVNHVLNTQDIVVYDNVIRRCAAVDHSVLVRRPLARCASKSYAALDYMDFTREYLEREEKHGIA